ncbi:hypothetical protein BC828DRAFT_382687 [Blastocladiella britannica]|nr:hypothetical protein BC828DRAFT_382687 [Blastocladiella britannica]
MKLIARLRALYFEFAFSITAENRLLELLETVGNLIEFFQISAFIFSQNYTWGPADSAIPTFQSILSITLLNFANTDWLNYTLCASVIVMDLALLVIGWQIWRQGGISSFRALQLARILIGVLSNFLFLPLIESAVHYASNFLMYGQGTLGFMFTLLICYGVGLVLPAFMTAYASHADPRKITWASRMSSRTTVNMLILKFVLSVSYGAVSTDIFPWILFICNTWMLGVGVFRGVFFSPLANIVWTGQQAALAAGSVILVIKESMDLDENDVASVFVGTLVVMAIAAVLAGAGFAIRLGRLAPGLNLIYFEWDMALKTAFCKSAKCRLSPGLLDAALKNPAGEVAKKVRYASEVMMLVDALFSVALRNQESLAPLIPYFNDIAARGAKRFPESDEVMYRYLAKLAATGDTSAQQKALLTTHIRRAVTRTKCKLDTRYGYYALLKSHEIIAFRQQGKEFRRMPVLSIISYHYNMTEAQKNYVLALELSNTFWSACKAGASPDALGCIADRLQEHQAEALRFLRTLVRRFPSSVPILKLYASFAFDVLCNEALGDEILDLAMRLGGGAGDGPQEKTVDDGKSERSGHQSSVTGRSSDVFKVGGAESIFDSGATEQSRDAESLTTIIALRTSARVAIVLMFLAVVALMVMNSHFGATEAAIRNLMYQAGLMRRASLDVIKQTRTLQILLLNSATQAALVAQQKILQTSASTLYDQLKVSFFLTGSQSTPDILSHWAWLAQPDRELNKLDVFLNPMETFQLQYLNAFDAGTAVTSTLTATRHSISWIVANGLTDSHFHFLLRLVSVYQTAYSGFLSNTFWTMATTAIVLGCLPLFALIGTVLPKWFTLRRELDSATRLFALIPSSVASTLASEMKSKLDSLTDAASDGDGQENATRGSVAVQAKGAKSTPLATQLFKALLGSSLVSVAFVGAMALSTVLPFQYYSNRAVLLNWPGIRFTGAVWTYLGMRELVQLAQTAPTTFRDGLTIGNKVDYWQTSVKGMVDLVVSLHASTLYGNDTLGIERTFGVFPAADAATFTPFCADLSNPECYSFDQNIAYIHELVQASLAAKHVPDTTLAEMARLVDLAGPLSQQNTAVRNLFTLAHEDTIQALNHASVWLLLCAFLAFGAMYVTLRQQFNAVEDRIKRTRSILFQIPEEAQNAIPIIRSYLRTGVLADAERGDMVDSGRIPPPQLLIQVDVPVVEPPPVKKGGTSGQPAGFKGSAQALAGDGSGGAREQPAVRSDDEFEPPTSSKNSLGSPKSSSSLEDGTGDIAKDGTSHGAKSTDFRSRMQDYIAGVEPLDIEEKATDMEEKTASFMSR